MKKRLFSFTQFVTAILVLLAFNPDHTSAVQSNLFKIYNRLQIDILHKKNTLREAGHFRNVLVNDSEFQSAKNLLSKISRVNDRDERNSLYDKLYKLFVMQELS